MKFTLLVTIESEEYEDVGDVSVALLNRLDGWDVGAAVLPLTEESTLDAKLGILNRKIRVAKDELVLLEMARDGVREEIRNNQAQQDGTKP